MLRVAVLLPCAEASHGAKSRAWWFLKTGNPLFPMARSTRNDHGSKCRTPSELPICLNSGPCITTELHLALLPCWVAKSASQSPLIQANKMGGEFTYQPKWDPKTVLTAKSPTPRATTATTPPPPPHPHAPPPPPIGFDNHGQIICPSPVQEEVRPRGQGGHTGGQCAGLSSSFAPRLFFFFWGNPPQGWRF